MIDYKISNSLVFLTSRVTVAFVKDTSYNSIKFSPSSIFFFTSGIFSINLFFKSWTDFWLFLIIPLALMCFRPSIGIVVKATLLFCSNSTVFWLFFSVKKYKSFSSGI